MNPTTETSTEPDSLENIRKRLLDLTAKNRLLNFRDSALRTSKLVNCNLNDLAHRLIREESALLFVP